MTQRKAITNRMKLQALLAFGGSFCAVCDRPFTGGDIDNIDWDHTVALALGGKHDWFNIRPLHRHCHRKKTFGNKATTAGSDIGKITKGRRYDTGKMRVTRKPRRTAAERKRPKKSRWRK